MDSTPTAGNEAAVRPLHFNPDDLAFHLLNAKAAQGKRGSLGLLIVTLVLFFSSNIISSKVPDVMVLIAVLLFHELGHLLMMKALRYNDVKMFFIPFFGAAVSGRSDRETVFKSCLVSLMGPLPGVVMSLALFLVFRLTKNWYVLKSGEVMATLNIFNLLPIMPLDGGRYIDSLYINNRRFRLVFSLLGVGAFLWMGASSGDFFLLILGALGIFSSLRNFKSHSAGMELKAAGVRAHTLEELVEDKPAFYAVLVKLQERHPKAFHPVVRSGLVYGYIEEILGILRLKPAGIAAKSALTLAYLFVLGASLIFGILFLAIDYKEKSDLRLVDGKYVTVSSRYDFGHKESEIPVDSLMHYHGEGKGFADHDSTRVIAYFYYDHGFRDGVWTHLDESGRVNQAEYYRHGQLDSVMTDMGGVRTVTKYSELRAYRRIGEWIMLRSQPFRSNADRF